MTHAIIDALGELEEVRREASDIGKEMGREAYNVNEPSISCPYIDAFQGDCEEVMGLLEDIDSLTEEHIDQISPLVNKACTVLQNAVKNIERVREINSDLRDSLRALVGQVEDWGNQLERI